MGDRRVALLRGINVGRAKRVAMADLRALFERLGYADVRTLLNSGNVVFTSPANRSPTDDAAQIEKSIADRLKVTTRVIVLRKKELADAVGGNPLAAVADDPSRLLLMALRDSKCASRLKPLLHERWAPDALAVGKRVAYLWCSTGLIDSRLWPAVSRVLGEEGTARNLTTMTKILALMESAQGG
jgi:uncharacterized protein (DUF1697 family)